MNRVTVTIPTYWGWESGRPSLPEDSIFDHPTPLDTEGTLPRTLNSLTELKSSDFQVILITAPVNPRLSESVEKKIAELMDRFKSYYPIAQFGPSDLKVTREIMSKNGLEDSILSLEAYAQIRNCQLFASMLIDTELIAAIDDDEVVPEDYIDKATLFAGKETAGKKIDGVAGIYLNAEGNYKLKEKPGIRAEKNIFIKKAALMNDEFSRYMESQERLTESAVALGGNMIFTKTLYMNVPFDPGITRGEDIDYLINSRLLGYNWFLDRELYITHLPPKPSHEFQINTSPYAKLQQDVLRFIYEKEKLAISKEFPDAYPLSAEQLGFYPGEFLKEGLEEQAMEALKRERPKDADERFFPKPEELLKRAKERAAMARKFFDFAKKWSVTMSLASKIEELKDYMQKKFD